MSKYNMDSSTMDSSAYIGSMTSNSNLGYLEEPFSGLNHSGHQSATPTATTSSKAVLNALKALQEKIKRLETERMQALDETSQLRHQLKTLEIETDHIKQREALTAQKNLQDARVSYDKLLSEKTELELRLTKVEEKHKSAKLQSDELQSRIRNLEDEKHKNLLRIKELEAQNLQIETQIQYTQRREKDVAETMISETKRHEHEVIKLNTKLNSLQQELESTVSTKEANRLKLQELDQLVGQLLQVNDKLLVQLSGNKVTKKKSTADSTSVTRRSVSPSTATSIATSKKTTIKKKATTNPVPRVANVTTAALEAGKVSKFMSSSGKAVQSSPVQSHSQSSSTDDVEKLHQLHKMYASIAQSILEKHQSTSSSSKSVTSEKKKTTGRSKTPTRMSKKKSSASSAAPYTSEQIFGKDLRDGDGSVSFSYPKMSSSHDDITLTNTSSSILSHRRASPSLVRYDSPSSETPNIHGVIASLEDEFETLNQQYRRLLGSVQGEDTTAETSRAEELVSIIQRLHKKGEQLRALKSPVK